MADGTNDVWRGRIEQLLEDIKDRQERSDDKRHELAAGVSRVETLTKLQHAEFKAHAAKVEEDLDGVPGDKNRPGLKATVAELKKAKDDVSLLWRVVRWLVGVATGAFGLFFTAGGTLPGVASWVGAFFR